MDFIKKYPAIISIVALMGYIIMSYMGIRAPDSEIVFRTTEALANKGTFAVSEELAWKGFGLPRGKDGNRYSLFGPLEAIAAVPLYKIAQLINDTEWYKIFPKSVPISFYIDDGLVKFTYGITPTSIEPHALRSIVGLFNAFICSICVYIFFKLIKKLTQSDKSALLTTILFAFGTLILPYSGTFFSECLAIMFLMLSLFYLIPDGSNMNHFSNRIDFRLLFSGLLVGLATATHITAILFAPFFCLYGAYSRNNIKENKLLLNHPIILHISVFIIGMGLIMAMIAYYNYVRFGDIFETGRTVKDQMKYAGFVSPWRGLWGLLFSSGKGIVLYCPVIVISLLFWRPFHNRYRLLSFMIIGATLFRIVFIASRSDWHGGICLGPRYMLMLIPFLMLPVGILIENLIEIRKVKLLWSMACATAICIAQQLYFSLGEVFSFYCHINWKVLTIGKDVFKNDILYLSWHTSPLLYLLRGKRGSSIFSSIPVNNYFLWAILALLASFFVFLVYYDLHKRPNNLSYSQ
jgi:hypothetical protein